MKKIPVKILSLVLAASIVLPVAACNKKGSKAREKSKSGQKITADSPWFDGELVTIKAPEIEEKKGKTVESTNQQLAGIDDKYIVIYTSGNYKFPTGDNVDWDSINYSDYMINIVSVMDRKTNETITNIDLTPTLARTGYIERVSLIDGKVMAHASEYDDKTYQMKYIDTYFDPATGNVADKKEQIADEDYRSYDRTFEFGIYTVCTAMNYEEGQKCSYNVYITKGDGDTQEFAIKSADKDIYDIPIVLQLGDDKFLVPATTDGDKLFFEIDLNSGKVTSVDAKNYEWLDLNNIGITIPGKESGVLYSATSTGIAKIDANKKTMEEIFNDSWCAISRSRLGYCQLIEASDDCFVLSGEKYSYGSVQEFFVITLTRAATNPHAGKTILEVYAPWGYVEENIADAIAEYNANNSGYFLEVYDRYSDVDDAIDYSQIYSDDDYQNANLKANAVMSNELAMDIMNGEGPDILLNVSSYGQLNNSNYLVDLNKYVGQLDSDKYFTNVIKAAETDGKLYQLPLSFMVSGIFTDSKYAGASGVGFTTAEYEKFLKDTLNGQDTINYGQAIYFTKLFTAMSDKFLVDGKVDFTSPEFAELAEFVKNNVPEKAKSWQEMYDTNSDDAYTGIAVGVTTFKGDTPVNNNVAAYTSIYGLGGYFSLVGQFKGASAILGIPSTDGRGPLLETDFSVAVSAQSKNADACGEFVKMLMSDDVQLSIAKSDTLVLNRKAFREASKETIKYYNEHGTENIIYYNSYPEADEQAKNQITFSDKNVDDFEKIILSISRMNSADASINMILVEEMPAYFSGQKDLNAVITIAQDRAQKVLAERG
ncbi:MAG: hypothetical protein IKT10_02475 [Clostridiales bacterium]|nr:hypothetical protein [Clostridiales bacterium]